jgi:ABC-type multidrug transport system permease subunit
MNVFMCKKIAVIYTDISRRSFAFSDVAVFFLGASLVLNIRGKFDTYTNVPNLFFIMVYLILLHLSLHSFICNSHLCSSIELLPFEIENLNI